MLLVGSRGYVTFEGGCIEYTGYIKNLTVINLLGVDRTVAEFESISEGEYGEKMLGPFFFDSKSVKSYIKRHNGY